MGAAAGLRRTLAMFLSSRVQLPRPPHKVASGINKYMEQKTFYYLYEIRNNLNGKIYVGVHKTNDMNDGYMGSGKIISSAIAKHGIANFSKVILETFENAEAMYAREKEVVTEDFLSRDDTYNLRRGGNGGFDYINMTRDHSAHNRRIAEKRDYKSKDYIATLSRAVRQQDISTRFDISSKSREGSEKARLICMGSKWITDGVTNRRWTLNDPLPDGWKYGLTRQPK